MCPSGHDGRFCSDSAACFATAIAELSHREQHDLSVNCAKVGAAAARGRPRDAATRVALRATVALCGPGSDCPAPERRLHSSCARTSTSEMLERERAGSNSSSRKRHLSRVRCRRRFKTLRMHVRLTPCIAATATSARSRSRVPVDVESDG